MTEAYESIHINRLLQDVWQPPDRILCLFYVICIKHCNIIIQYKPTKSKLHVLLYHIAVLVLYNFFFYVLILVHLLCLLGSSEFYVFCAVYCNIIIQYKPTKFTSNTIFYLTRLMILLHVKHTIPYLYIQPSSWRWTLWFETCRRSSSSSSSSCSGRIRFDSCSLCPQNETGPSISSSVVLCVFVFLVYIVVLI